MLTSAISVIGTAAAGSGIKIIAGLLQNAFDAAAEKRRVQHEQRMAELGKEIKAYEAQTANPYTNHTRRRLAYIVCTTLCAIACFCTVFPDILFWTIPPSGGQPESRSILFGLFEWTATPNVEPFIITSGAMAYLFVHASIAWMSFYFTPIGKR